MVIQHIPSQTFGRRVPSSRPQPEDDRQDELRQDERQHIDRRQETDAPAALDPTIGQPPDYRQKPDAQALDVPDGQAIGRQAEDSLILDPPDGQPLDVPDGLDPPPVRRRKPTPQQRARLIAEQAEQEARIAEAGRLYQQVRARSKGANGKLPSNYHAVLERGVARSRA